MGGAAGAVDGLDLAVQNICAFTGAITEPRGMNRKWVIVGNGPGPGGYNCLSGLTCIDILRPILDHLRREIGSQAHSNITQRGPSRAKQGTSKLELLSQMQSCSCLQSNIYEMEGRGRTS